MSAQSLGIQHGRETLRCQCGLVQWKGEHDRCRRCGLHYVEQAAPVSVLARSIDDSPVERKKMSIVLQFPEQSPEYAPGPLNVGGAVRLCRKALCITQKELSRRINLPRANVSRLENKKNTAVTCSYYSLILQLAAAFGLHPAVFVALCQVPGL
jgi:hypothetical protein